MPTKGDDEMQTYAVFQDYGTFILYEPTEDGSFVRDVIVPETVGETFEEERAWFLDWCQRNGVEPIFDN
jgi:hypothetical protein